MTEYCLCVFTSLFITVRPINFMDGKNAREGISAYAIRQLRDGFLLSRHNIE